MNKEAKNLGQMFEQFVTEKMMTKEDRKRFYDILDYSPRNVSSYLSEDAITAYESLEEVYDRFSLITDVDFGGSEGIYLDLDLVSNDRKTGIRIGTFKTLESSFDAMKTMYEMAAYYRFYYDSFMAWAIKKEGEAGNG